MHKKGGKIVYIVKKRQLHNAFFAGFNCALFLFGAR